MVPAGLVSAGLPGAVFWPTPGRSATGSMPRARTCPAGPMPDSSSTCGDPTAPAHTITSPTACAVTGAPVADIGHAGAPAAPHLQASHQAAGHHNPGSGIGHRPQVRFSRTDPLSSSDRQIDPGDALLHGAARDHQWPGALPGATPRRTPRRPDAGQPRVLGPPATGPSVPRSAGSRPSVGSLARKYGSRSANPHLVALPTAHPVIDRPVPAHMRQRVDRPRPTHTPASRIRHRPGISLRGGHIRPVRRRTQVLRPRVRHRHRLGCRRPPTVVQMLWDCHV